MAEDSSEITREMAESVAAANLKVVGDTPAYMMGLAYQQALDAAAGWRSINQAIVGKWLRRSSRCHLLKVASMWPRCSSS